MSSLSLQDEIEDSRSSVGRKRDIAELSPHQDATTISSDEETTERSAKRKRQASEGATKTPPDADMNFMGTAMDQEEHRAGGILYSEDSSNSQIGPLTSWNGVQGGLRTSFGRKAKSSQAFPLPKVHSTTGETLQTIAADDIVNTPMEDGRPLDTPEDDISSLPSKAGNGAEIEMTADPITIEDSGDDTESDPEYPHDQAVDILQLPQKSSADNRPPYGEELTSPISDPAQANASSNMAGQTLGNAEILNYPRDISNFVAATTIKGMPIQLLEMFANGLPISIHDLLYDNFVAHIWQTNPKLKAPVKRKSFRAPFSLYVSLYYGHYLEQSQAVVLDGIQIKRQSLKLKKGSHRLQAGLVPPQGVPVAQTKPEKAKTKDEKPTSQADRHALKSGNESVPAFTPINTRRGSTAIVSRAETSAIAKPSHSGAKNCEDVDMQNTIEPLNGTIDVDLDIKRAEHQLQLKYFPPVEGKPNIPRCLACADSGHETFGCPGLSCTLCGGFGHSNFTCPQHARCGKCRQKGHSTQSCTEKLLPSKAELGNCEICNSSNHVEVGCHMIWRSYAPKPDEIRTVSGIPVHCYSCGASTHYGSECGLHRRGRIMSGGVTWSRVNLEKYLDQDSNVRAIASGRDLRINRGFSIKGKATDPIDLDDTEDEDSFIRPRINNSSNGGRGNGQIRFGQPSRSEFELPSGHRQYPQRWTAPQFGSGYRHTQDDSGRYGRERTFSPPPIPSYTDFNPSSRNDQHYNSYRPLPHRQPPPPDTRDPPGGNRGGRSRGHRPHRGGAKNVARSPPPNQPPKKKSKKAKKAKAERGGKA